MLIEIDPERPKLRRLEKAADALRQGEVIIYPTDTCYGLGCDIFNKKAIERIYQIKQVPKTTPFSFICPDLSHISTYARVTDYAYRIMKRFLPGPYTFVLEGTRTVPKMMLTKRKTVGIRVPDHPICRLLAEMLGNPLISTSVSGPSGTIMSDPREMAEELGKQVAVIVDTGIIPPEPSSVISLISDQPEILREGKGDVSLFY